MKKQTTKKLALGKIKIAKLKASQPDQMVPTYTGCSLIKCPPPKDI